VEVRAGCEELQGDVVGVAEGQGEAEGVLGDVVVGDPELVQMVLPLLEVAAVGAAEAEVVQSGPELVEPMAPVGGRVGD
jgi:hypothetical protein